MGKALRYQATRTASTQRNRIAATNSEQPVQNLASQPTIKLKTDFSIFTAIPVE